jgi:hypothetical protein
LRLVHRKIVLAGFFRRQRSLPIEKVMKNYVITYEPTDKHSVLNLVRNFSNDVQIDRVEEDRVGITIELEDDQADQKYDRLREDVREMVEVRAKHYTGD